MRCDKLGSLFVACGFMLAVCMPLIAQTCPTFTKKTTVDGTTAGLPDGWFVYTKSNGNGLFKSDIKTFAEQAVPNTTGDRTGWADISDDGQWLLYLAVASDTNKIYLIKPDGSLRTRVPATIDWEKGGAFPVMPRFYRGSPNGNEIVYVSGGGRLRAIGWSVSGNTVQFGNTRILFSYQVHDSVTANGYAWYGWISGGEGLGIWKDQILFETFFPPTPTSFPPQYSLPGYITIPGGGTGTATRSNFFQWANSIDSSTYGCGHTMSHNGRFCVSNSGYIGSSCVPNKNAVAAGNSMDHKGFYVAPFFKSGDPAIDIMTIPDQHGLSINWCPSAYQYGSYSQVDFGLWSFSNDTGYVIGVQQGNGTNSKPAVKSVWLVHWPTNTWTPLTPSTNPAGSSGTTYTYPAVFFTNLAGVQKKPHGLLNSGRVPAAERAFTSTGSAIDLARGMHDVAVYSLAGQVLYSYHRDQAESSRRISLPQSVRNAGCVVTKYEIDR